jgi:beta-1,4-mannosyl-glycoprotein beta-1,4-N-acetylglucosaminyltransferase
VQESNNLYLAEIGSWHGRSARAIADNMPKDAVLFCIDTWNGSETEQETNHSTAKLNDGDNAYLWFCREMWDHIISGRVVPLRMTSHNAAHFLLEKGIKLAFIFVDGGHEYDEVVEDIRTFMPLKAEGGLMCGHDFMQGLMCEVTPAVLDTFGGNVGHAPMTTIWFTDAKIAKPLVYDCITLNDELDILELRLQTLDSVVDRFVISEAPVTHQGQPKPLYFKENMDRFGKYLNKITHIIPSFDNLINGDEIWNRERLQRDALIQGLPANGNPWVIMSDADEIPNPDSIKDYKGFGIAAFDMQLFYYNPHWKNKLMARDAKITTARKVRELTPCGVRYSKPNQLIPNGGKHYSYFGGEERVQRKLKSFAHWEYNKPEFTSLEHIRKCIEKGLDLFGRKDQQFEYVK